MRDSHRFVGTGNRLRPAIERKTERELIGWRLLSAESEPVFHHPEPQSNVYRLRPFNECKCRSVRTSCHGCTWAASASPLVIIFISTGSFPVFKTAITSTNSSMPFPPNTVLAIEPSPVCQLGRSAENLLNFVVGAQRSAPQGGVCSIGELVVDFLGLLSSSVAYAVTIRAQAIAVMKSEIRQHRAPPWNPRILNSISLLSV